MDFEQNAEEEITLNDFLEEVALVADIDSLDENTNVVTLMTLHSAKGLEFPNVFLCGMEDGLFPGYMSITSDDPMDIEEERRLCYVGITRAMKTLHLTCAMQRMQNGQMQFNKPSRFIREIPRYLLTQTTANSIYGSSGLKTRQSNGSSTLEKPYRFVSSDSTSSSSYGTGSYNRNSNSDPFAGNPLIQKGFRFEKPYQASKPATNATVSFEAPAYQVGDTVSHVKFGTGKVLDIQKGPKDYVVTVDFESAGKKKMMAVHAKLTKM